MRFDTARAVAEQETCNANPLWMEHTKDDGDLNLHRQALAGISVEHSAWAIR